MGKLARKTAIPPKRVKNSERRSREYLTPNEIEKLLNATKQVGRYGQRGLLGQKPPKFRQLFNS